MTNKIYIKAFSITSVIATTLFFVFGNLLFDKLFEYRDWILVVFPINIIISFHLMLPLLFPFRFIDSLFKSSKSNTPILLTFIKSTLATIYIAAILWFSIFSDLLHEVQIGKSDKTKFYSFLDYLGLSATLNILVFAITI